MTASAPGHRLVYDPDPRAGATLYRDYGDWRWDPPNPVRPLPGDNYVAVVSGRSRLSGTWSPRHRTYHSHGTVARGQRRGTASGMWAHLISTLRPAICQLEVITPAGKAMAASLRRQHPDVTWRVTENLA